MKQGLQYYRNDDDDDDDDDDMILSYKCKNLVLSFVC